MGKHMEQQQTNISLPPSFESESKVKEEDQKSNKSGDSMTENLKDFHKDLFERRRARQRNKNTKNINKTLDALDDDSFANEFVLAGTAPITTNSFIQSIVSSTASYDDPPSWVLWLRDELRPKLKRIRRKVTSRKFIHNYGPYLFLFIGFAMTIMSIRLLFRHSSSSATTEAAAASESLQQQLLLHSDTDAALSLKKVFSPDTSPFRNTNQEIIDSLPSHTHEENMKLRGKAADDIEKYEKMLPPPSKEAWRPRKYGENKYHHPKIISAGELSYDKNHN